MIDGKSSYRSVAPLILLKLSGLLLFSFRSKRHFARLLLTQLMAACGDIQPIELSELAALNDQTVESNLREGAVVALIAKALGAKQIFEFGTFRGRTSMLLAAISPDVQVVTIDLPPNCSLDFVQAQAGSSIEITCPNLFDGMRGSLIKGEYGSRIKQLRQSSADLDASRYRGQFELIYIDGSHSYSAVKSDTEKALVMLAPRGTIVWDDYPRPGVWRYLNELDRARPELGLRYLHKWDKVVTVRLDSVLLSACPEAS
jgi:predicted O-methyltransferase YrrM